MVGEERVSKRETLLLIDAGASPMEGLSQRLRAIGYRVLRTKNVEQGYAALSDRGDPLALAAGRLVSLSDKCHLSPPRLWHNKTRFVFSSAKRGWLSIGL